uniref:Uncharacterized protein n=1 Tax=Strombidium rassoulzadegani TaxID=1082188 RepID=A0A7S3CLA3_9SPIT|mmetsp:Transcript_15665/g.26431  ORF Transcript_15665/g.26431 Transcript_15665/m.26431 type:complete len:109 (+) Transcript_15665:24-350(+)
MSTSVRPLTVSEEIHARGQPLTGISTIFGFTFGVLTHMRMHKVTAQCNWFPTPQSKLVGSAMMVGGGVLGYLTGKFLFSDFGLQRLIKQHELDRASNTAVHRQDLTSH